jgi:hypothetical protein
MRIEFKDTHKESKNHYLDELNKMRGGKNISTLES